MQSSSTAFRGSVQSIQRSKERLDSWKEVASFFRREVRTVQLWEKSEGLPVRRQHHKKLGSIYAYRQELEAWWAARSAAQARPAGATTGAEKLTDQSIAVHACAMGFYYWQKRGRGALVKAISYFKDAIDLEPRCAEAYAGLADTYVSLSYNHMMPPVEAAQQARDAVDAALKLDRNSIKVRNALINLLIHCLWNLSAAERECRDLLATGRHDARTLQLYSTLMNLRGRHQEAIDLALHAYRLAPESDLINGQMSLAYFYAGDYESARYYIRRTIDLEPQFLMGYALLGRTEAEIGNWDEAIKAFQRGLEISPHSLFIRALLAYAYAGCGDVLSAHAILRELEERSQDECFPAYDVSAVHAILKQDNEALRKIHEAYGARDMKTIFMQHDPRFARLRNAAGFQQIASALDLEANRSGNT